MTHNRMANTMADTMSNTNTMANANTMANSNATSNSNTMADANTMADPSEELRSGRCSSCHQEDKVGGRDLR